MVFRRKNTEKFTGQEEVKSEGLQGVILIKKKKTEMTALCGLPDKNFPV